MIKAYLVGISTQFEGEEIEVRYRIYDGDEQVSKKSRMLKYRKPALVGHVAMSTLLKELEVYKDRDIVVIINDGALYETIRGTSGTKNQEILEKAKETRNELKNFENLEVRNISGFHEEISEWNEILKP